MPISRGQRYLTNLRFADDVALFAQQRADIVKMLQHLSDRSATFGLEIHFDKTKILTWGPLADGLASVPMGGRRVAVIAEEESERYLGRKLSLQNPHEVELDNRLAAGWAAFHANKSELCSKFYSLSSRLQLFNAVVAPVVLYACATWALKKAMETKLHSTWRQMLRYILRIHRRKSENPSRTPEPWIDFVQRAARTVEDSAANLGLESWLKTYRRKKWQLAGGLARHHDRKWSKIILDWRPASQRDRQRPLTRWSDSISNFAGGDWQASALDEGLWASLEEGFVAGC